MANALTRIGKEFQPLVPPRGSVAASVQAARARSAMVAAAFHHVPAKELGDLDHPIESDVLICSDHPRGHRGHRRDRRPRSRTCARSTAGELSQRHADRVVHRRAAAAQRPLQDPGRGEVHRASRSDRRAHVTDAPLRAPPGGRSCPFEPGPVVTMYTCGITPYDATHLGHAAVYVTYDVLQRRLRDRGHDTRCVRNITDVDDSILGKARELGVHYLDLAAAEIGPLRRRHGGARPAAESWSEPRATSAIADIRGFIGMVLDRGHAYQAGGARLLRRVDVRRLRLGRRATSRDEMLALAAERGGNVDDPQQARPARLRAVAAVAPTTSRRGSRCGARAARAGTSSARRWPCASSAPRSTSTAAAPT